MKIVLKTVQCLAVALPAMALLQSGVSLLVMPSNSEVAVGTYVVVVHGGWRFGVVLVGAVIATAILAVLARKQPTSFWLAIVGWVMLTATLTILMLWIYPANAVTGNWTADWPSLRQKWEYGYAAIAILTFIALCAVAGSVVARRE
jgi:energy-coupling factor transporter transmembrane protein EcfT